MLTSFASRNEGPARRANTVYFDITDVVDHAERNKTVTGIQRVVTKVLESIIGSDTGGRYRGLVRTPSSGAFMAADLSFLRGPHDYSDFAARFERGYDKEVWLQSKLKKYNARSARAFLKMLWLKLQWSLSRKLRDRVTSNLLTPKPSCLSPLNLAKGDVIVTLGAGWCTEYREVHDLARRAKCEVVSFVYDIIPITHPQFAPDKDNRFRNWVDYVAENSSLICTISKFSKGELIRYLNSHGPHANLSVIKFPHEFKTPSTAPALNVSIEVQRIVGTNFMLCIGTLDQRKNILGLLRAWRELNEQGFDMPDVVICGGPGRGVDEIQQFLRLNENDAGEAVTIIQTPNDTELEILYRACQFSVFPSFVEGWGLPIGESLWFGKPVICANSASMPEAGGQFATYFDHGKPESLREALLEMIRHPVKLPPNVRGQLTTWEGTAASICDAINLDRSQVFADKVERASA